jgi:hypothetical protein
MTGDVAKVNIERKNYFCMYNLILTALMIEHHDEINPNYIIIPVIIVFVVVGVVIAAYQYNPDNEIAFLNTLYTVASGAGVVLFLHIINMKNDAKRDLILNELHYSNELQQKIRLSNIRAPLLDIKKDLEALIGQFKKDKETVEDKKKQTTLPNAVRQFLRSIRNNTQYLELTNKIYCRSNSIQDNIDELYEDIVSAAKHFEDANKLDLDDTSRDPVKVWDDLTDEAISTSRSCILKIDRLLNYGPPDSKYFEGLDVLHSLMKLGRFNIIVGCKPVTQDKDRVSRSDYEAAKQLQKYLQTKINVQESRILAIIERDREHDNEDPIKIDKMTRTLHGLKGNDLILIGGLRPNLLTKEINSYLLVPYMQYGKLNGFYSRITEQSYTQGDGGKSWAVIQGIKNPFNLKRVVILIYGLTREGTTKAIEELMNRMDIYLKDVKESGKGREIGTNRGTEKPIYPAEILEV